MSAVTAVPQRHRLTVAEYYRLEKVLPKRGDMINPEALPECGLELGDLF